MKHLILGLAVVAGLWSTISTAVADPGGYVPPNAPGGGGSSFGPMGGPGTLLGAGDLPPGRGPAMYGWNPGLKKFFHFKGIGRSKHASGPDYAAMGYGMGGPGYMPGGQGMGGPMMQGTLVFPNHSFVRSPRDYFMVDVNK